MTSHAIDTQLYQTEYLTEVNISRKLEPVMKTGVNILLFPDF